MKQGGGPRGQEQRAGFWPPDLPSSVQHGTRPVGPPFHPPVNSPRVKETSSSLRNGAASGKTLFLCAGVFSNRGKLLIACPVVIFSQTRDAVTFLYSLSQLLMKIRCSRNPRVTPHQTANSSSLFRKSEEIAPGRTCQTCLRKLAAGTNGKIKGGISLTFLPS